MIPRVMLATLDANGLASTLNAARERLPLLYLESETRVLLVPLADYLASPARLPAARWQTGRAFGTELEIRWSQEDLLIEAQALAESDITPPGWTPSDWNERLDPVTQTRHVLLAGLNSSALPPNHSMYNKAGGSWVADSIARPLTYPVGDPLTRRVALRCIDYVSGGLVVLTRLCELIPYQENA